MSCAAFGHGAWLARGAQRVEVTGGMRAVRSGWRSVPSNVSSLIRLLGPQSVPELLIETPKVPKVLNRFVAPTADHLPANCH